jgi:HD superfamily phosphodiesterase
MTGIFTQLMRFVIASSAKYGIDESHGLSHSLSVLHFANKIYEAELYTYPSIKPQEKIIYTAAIVHDMCDSKYFDNIDEGISRIDKFLTTLKTPTVERNIIIDIVDTMSYSKIKQNGFPCHGEYQRAFHIVREADLLSAYDFDRCMLFKMHKTQDGDLGAAFEDAEQLFKTRMFKHKTDGLLTTQYAIDNHEILVAKASERIESWRNTIGRVRNMEKI